MKYKDKKVAVLGFGRSGKSCVKALIREGAKIFVSESSKLAEDDFAALRGEWGKEYGSLCLEGEFNGHTDRVIDQDLIIISPGIPSDLPVLEKARKAGLRIIGELEFAYEKFTENKSTNSAIIGVTGTNGKTTTVHLINSVLKSAGINSVVCGNVGMPFTEIVNKMSEQSETTVPVIEISSFQLESIEAFKPMAGVLLNVTPDHLNRYKNLESYREAKLRLFMNQGKADFAVLNAKDSELQSRVKSGFFKAQTMYFSASGGKDVFRPDIWVEEDTILYKSENQTEKFARKELNIKWNCLMEDYLASILVIKALKRDIFPEISDEHIIKGFKDFKGVSHRMEEVGVFKKIRVINNSMCTNPDAFIKVIKGLKPGNREIKGIILIAGGKEKNFSISGMVGAINESAKYCVLIGESAERLKEGVQVKYDCAKDMQKAVELAFKNAVAGDMVILSPGFASFDWYKDYSERGEDFKKTVLEYFKK